jgi:hypothetical protein
MGGDAFPAAVTALDESPRRRRGDPDLHVNVDRLELVEDKRLYRAALPF